jgi:uncharacterized protein YkwD
MQVLIQPFKPAIGAVLVSTILLSACGSGTNLSDGTLQSSSPAPTTAAATAPSPGTNNAAPSAVMQQATKILNDIRAKQQNCGGEIYPPQPPLAWNNAVAKAAEIESQWMQTNNAFSHVWPDGTGPGERLKMANYNWSNYAENIAAGQPTVEAVMTSWLASPGHCANMMRAGVTEWGLSEIEGTAQNTYKTYWTMVVAKPK